MSQRDLSIAELAALQALSTELPRIRQELSTLNEWLDSINANLQAMAEITEPIAETIFEDTPLPEGDDGQP